MVGSRLSGSEIQGACYSTCVSVLAPGMLGGMTVWLPAKLEAQAAVQGRMQAAAEANRRGTLVSWVGRPPRFPLTMSRPQPSRVSTLTVRTVEKGHVCGKLKVSSGHRDMCPSGEVSVASRGAAVCGNPKGTQAGIRVGDGSVCWGRARGTRSCSSLYLRVRPSQALLLGPLRRHMCVCASVCRYRVLAGL